MEHRIERDPQIVVRMAHRRTADGREVASHELDHCLDPSASDSCVLAALVSSTPTAIHQPQSGFDVGGLLSRGQESPASSRTTNPAFRASFSSPYASLPSLSSASAVLRARSLRCNVRLHYHRAGTR